MFDELIQFAHLHFIHSTINIGEYNVYFNLWPRSIHETGCHRTLSHMLYSLEALCVVRCTLCGVCLVHGNVKEGGHAVFSKEKTSD